MTSWLQGQTSIATVTVW